MRWMIVVAMGLALCAACGDDAEPDETAQVCAPGKSEPCTCAGGELGGQACNADGTGYEPCVCQVADAGPDALSDVCSPAALTSACDAQGSRSDHRSYGPECPADVAASFGCFKDAEGFWCCPPP